MTLFTNRMPPHLRETGPCPQYINRLAILVPAGQMGEVKSNVGKLWAFTDKALDSNPTPFPAMESQFSGSLLGELTYFSGQQIKHQHSDLM